MSKFKLTKGAGLVIVSLSTLSDIKVLWFEDHQGVN